MDWVPQLYESIVIGESPEGQPPFGCVIVPSSRSDVWAVVVVSAKLEKQNKQTNKTNALHSTFKFVILFSLLFSVFRSQFRF